MLLIVTGRKAPDLSGPRYRVLLTLTRPLSKVPPTTTPTPRTSYTPFLVQSEILLGQEYQNNSADKQSSIEDADFFSLNGIEGIVEIMEQ